MSLAGDSLTVPQIQKIYGDVTHLNPNTTFHFIARILFGWAVPEMGKMLEWFRDVGYNASTEECRKIHPETMDFATWAKKNLA